MVLLLLLLVVAVPAKAPAPHGREQTDALGAGDAELKAAGSAEVWSSGARAHSNGLLAGICEDSAGTLSGARAGAPCPGPGGRRVQIAGANIFDQLWLGSSGMSTCCNATGGPATYADARAALEAAAASGIRVFRFFGALYGDANKLWVRDPALFWSEYDRLVDDIERLGLYAVLSIGEKMWWQVANAVTPGLNETLNDEVRNRSSVAWRLKAAYVEQVVVRYRGRRSILFWELGNELNLNVNLAASFCGGGAQCYNTADMVQYQRDAVAIIRALDPARPVSSGFAAGRASAWHQEHCPDKAQQNCTSGYWGTDTKEQWLQMMGQQNDAVDIISLHSYDSDSPDSCYFDAHNCSGTFASPGGSVVAAAVEYAAATLGKPVYVGEYGGPGPTFTGPSAADQAYPAAVLDYQVQAAPGAGSTAGGVGAAASSSAFPLSTIWAWACPSHRADMACIWPNSTRAKEAGSNRMLKLLTTANEKMQL